MGLLSLDDAGEEAVAAWLANSPDNQSIARVEELLYDVSYGRALSPKWYVRRDLRTASDRLVEVTPNLIVVIRTYSDQDPEQMFSVVRIVDAGRRR